MRFTKDDKVRPALGHLPIPTRKRVEHDKLPPFPRIEEAFRVEGKAGKVSADLVEDGLGECYVVKTSPLHEPRAVVNIERLGFPVYRPTGVRWREYRRADRIIRVRRPLALMPGYLFVRLPEDPPFKKIRECEGVGDFVYEDGHPGRVKPVDAGQIFANQLDSVFDETVPLGMHWVRPGVEVILESGPLRFFNGTVESVDMDVLRATIEVLMLGKSVRQTLGFDEIRERTML